MHTKPTFKQTNKTKAKKNQTNKKHKPMKNYTGKWGQKYLDSLELYVKNRKSLPKPFVLSNTEKSLSFLPV